MKIRKIQLKNCYFSYSIELKTKNLCLSHQPRKKFKPFRIDNSKDYVVQVRISWIKSKKNFVGVQTVRVPPNFLFFQQDSKFFTNFKNFSNILYIKLKVFKRPFRNWKQFYNWLKCWWVIRVWIYIHFSELGGAAIATIFMMYMMH